MKKELSCTCPASVYGGFKQGSGIALGFLLIAGVPMLLLGVFALPAYLGSLTRAAASTTPTIKGVGVIDLDPGRSEWVS